LIPWNVNVKNAIGKMITIRIVCKEGKGMTLYKTVWKPRIDNAKNLSTIGVLTSFPHCQGANGIGEDDVSGRARGRCPAWWCQTWWTSVVDTLKQRVATILMVRVYFPQNRTTWLGQCKVFSLYKITGCQAYVTGVYATSTASCLYTVKMS
jgi:hypothetical protein